MELLSFLVTLLVVLALSSVSTTTFGVVDNIRPSEVLRDINSSEGLTYYVGQSGSLTTDDRGNLVLFSEPLVHKHMFPFHNETRADGSRRKVNVKESSHNYSYHRWIISWWIYFDWLLQRTHIFETKAKMMTWSFHGLIYIQLVLPLIIFQRIISLERVVLDLFTKVRLKEVKKLQ
ncbi:hypothetical protein CsatA_006618 [Cannabis sativa]